MDICTEFKVSFGIWGQSCQFINVGLSFLEGKESQCWDSAFFLNMVIFWAVPKESSMGLGQLFIDWARTLEKPMHREEIVDSIGNNF